MDFLRYLESIRTPMLTQLFRFFTMFGGEIFVIGIACALYWCMNKQLAYKLSFTYFASGLLVQTLKITFRIDRPWILDSNFHPVESAVPTATGYSFPSGHTQGSTALFSTLAFHVRNHWLKLLYVGCFLMVGLSRMYLGVHTPKDVFVSMLLTLAISYFMNRFMDQYALDTSKDIFISIFIGVISIGVMIYSLLLLKNNTIGANYTSDCCKAAGAGLGYAFGFYIERSFIQFDTHTSKTWQQILKFLVGIGITILLKSWLKFLLGSSIPADMIRYFLVILWVIAIYPFILKTVQSTTSH